MILISDWDYFLSFSPCDVLVCSLFCCPLFPPESLSVLFERQFFHYDQSGLGVHRVQNREKMPVFLLRQPTKSICITPGMVSCSIKTHPECWSSEVLGQVGSCPALKLKFRGLFFLLDTVGEAGLAVYISLNIFEYWWQLFFFRCFSLIQLDIKLLNCLLKGFIVPGWMDCTHRKYFPTWSLLVLNLATPRTKDLHMIIS